MKIGFGDVDSFDPNPAAISSQSLTHSCSVRATTWTLPKSQASPTFGHPWEHITHSWQIAGSTSDAVRALNAVYDTVLRNTTLEALEPTFTSLLFPVLIRQRARAYTKNSRKFSTYQNWLHPGVRSLAQSVLRTTQKDWLTSIFINWSLFQHFVATTIFFISNPFN